MSLPPWEWWGPGSPPNTVCGPQRTSGGASTRAGGRHRERSGRRTGQCRTPGGGRGELPHHRGDGRPHRPDLPRRQPGTPPGHREAGCVISEYPPESEPVGAVGFLQRNRLIAALSGALVVVEAKEKSGTMSTVGHAERYGKPVFAVPGSIFSPASAGTNALLRDGRAKAVCTAADLFGTLGLQTARPAPAPRETPRPPE